MAKALLTEVTEAVVEHIVEDLIEEVEDHQKEIEAGVNCLFKAILIFFNRLYTIIRK